MDNVSPPLPAGDRLLILTPNPGHAARMARTLLGLGCPRPETASSSGLVDAWLQEPPALVLADLCHCSPLELRQLRHVTGSTPWLGFSYREPRLTASRAVAAGLEDCLVRPDDPAELRLRLNHLLELRSLRQESEVLRRRLDKRAEEQIEDLEEMQSDILDRLALVAEYRDDATHAHTQRVARLAALLAKQLGLPGGQVALLRRTASLHDIGKIAIPDSVLLKPGPLTSSEFELVRQHTTIGARILSQSRFPLLRQAATIAFTHHERWDGGGYPEGQDGPSIPLVGRIVAVADTWDVLTHDRPYRRAWPATAALAEIQSESGRQFDPRVVQALLAVRGKPE